jgi:uncharacterized membrane protein
VRALLDGLRDVVEANRFWVTWNLFLAFVPWAMSLVLFRPERRRRVGPLWWVGLVVCIAFLPNASYVLTDVIHLPEQVRAETSDKVVLFGVLPMFAALFTLGFLAYVDTLRRLSAFVVARGWVERAWPLVFAVHAASAVGIYAGRIHRYNSWDLLTRPMAVFEDTFKGFTRPMPILGMAFTFAVLVVGYAITRPLLDAISGLRARWAASRRREGYGAVRT